MSHFLAGDILHIGRARTCAAAAHLLLLQTPLARSLSQSLEVAAPGDHRQPLTLSYLIQSCGLSADAALDASNKVLLITRNNPDSILRLLRDYGCSSSHIAAMIAKHPGILLRSEKNLKPKLEFFREIGISGHHLEALLSANPRLLFHSLEKKIAPSVGFLKELVSGGTVADILRISPRLHPETQALNVQTLRRHGVPEAGISKLLVTAPLTLARSPDWFGEVITTLEGMGLDPGRPMFVRALAVMAYMCKETWERKVAIYRSVGWSDEGIWKAFVRQPNCLVLSDDMIRQKTEFFAGKLGLRPGDICRRPTVMTLGLNKRIVPRCAVLKVLMSRGVLRRKVSVVVALLMSEKRFQEKFMNKYMDRVPEVVDAHQGKVEFDGFGELSRLGGSSEDVEGGSPPPTRGVLAHSSSFRRFSRKNPPFPISEIALNTQVAPILSTAELIRYFPSRADEPKNFADAHSNGSEWSRRSRLELIWS